MIKRIAGHYDDKTLSKGVEAGQYIYLSHHSGGHEKEEVSHQMRKTFEGIKDTLSYFDANLSDMLQVNLYLKTKEDFEDAISVFGEYFEEENAPTRTTVITDFVDEGCLCQIDGVAYKENVAG